VICGPGIHHFQQRIGAVTDQAPDVVFVEGGSNDLSAPSDLITDAAAETLQAVKGQLSGNSVVVAIGPVFVPGRETEKREFERVSAALAAAAERVNVPFIDPVGEGWLGDSKFFGVDDHNHPNLDGQAEFSADYPTISSGAA